MAHRHFGLGHLRYRAQFLPRKLATARRSLSFRAGYAAERGFQSLKDRLSEACRSTADVIAVWAVELFHDDQTGTPSHPASHPVEVKL